MKVVGLCLLLSMTALPDAGAQVLGWADEFLVAHVHCRLSNNGCNFANHWAGNHWLDEDINDPYAHPTWAFVGYQTNAGRANARAKVMVTFRDDSTTASGSLTVTLSRKRTGVPGSEGSACSGITFVGSVAQTYESTSYPVEYWRFNNRMLPVMDFSLEPWSGGAEIGYEDTVQLSTTMGSSGPKKGCYRLVWL